VGYVPYTTPLLKAFLKAGVESGYKLTDYNAPRSHIGFSQIQATVKGGRRASAVSSFIKPILGIRPNFHFFLRSQATKVLIDPATMTAYGVEYIRNGVKRVVKARKEVILSAGAFNTPQLLMLSGIGHKDHLESLGIPCLVDLPVGDGLMEHIGMNGLVFLLDQNVGIRTVAVTRAVPQLMAEATRGRGPLTSLGCEGIAFIQTKYANQTDDVPDIELLFVPAGINNDGGNALRKTMDITDSLYNTVYGPVNYKDSFTIWPILLYPKSKGYVRLRNKVPTSKVRIYANFLTEREDVLTMVEGIKAAVSLAESAAFKKYGARLHKTPIPECEELGFGTDPYWECTVRYITSQFHHQCCTAPMGPVLDPRLRVRGVAHLRVADASVMPTIPGAHTQAPAYMIGEKAADLIKQDWQMPY
jgi:choline dehydrogenase